MEAVETSDEKLKSLRTLTLVVYVLQAAGFFLGITWIIAVVINYVKREDVAGTWLESHCRWQIRTFWFGLLWGVIGGILVIVFVGFAVLFANAVWIIYRIVKGWLYLNDSKPMP
jgi:uncharacterized membrane protein